MSVVANVPVLGQVHVLTQVKDSIPLKCIEYIDIKNESVYYMKPDTLIRYSCRNYFVDDYFFYIAYIDGADKMFSNEVIRAISRLRVKPVELKHYWTHFTAAAE